MLRLPLLAASLLLLTVTSVLAMPCHCLPNRTYDRDQPVAADPYFLVTTQNSFFSVSFKIDKREVVFAKQKPAVTSEGLWVAYWLAQRTGQSAADLMKARLRQGGWRSVVAEGAWRQLPQSWHSLVAAGASEQQLSQYVVDTMLEKKGLASRRQLEELRKEGGNDQQAILAAVLGRKRRESPVDLFRQVRQGSKSWSLLVHEAGMGGRDMVSEIEGLLAGELSGKPGQKKAVKPD